MRLILPLSSTKLALVHTPTSVPTVSNISIKRNVNTTTTMSSVKILSSSNWQKIGAIDSGCDTTPLNSVTPIGIPISMVTRIPISIAPGVLRINIKPVITRPIRANSAEPPVMSPRVTSVESLATTTPALSKPMKAINRPIPAPMALRRLRGMAFTIASRTLVTVSRINTNPSSRIAVRANCHE